MTPDTHNDPSAMSVPELEAHIAALKEDLEEVRAEKAFLQRLTKQQVPGHQIERYESEIASIEAAIEAAEGLLAPSTSAMPEDYE